MAYPYNGQLNSNEVYTALYNMIISQRVFSIDVATPELADKLRVDGSMYGDTKLYHSLDIMGSADWGNDAEATNLLNLKRNKSQKTQAIKLDKFRQTMVTVDYYMSKRAFNGEGTFADFNGVLIKSLNDVKKVYDNGLVNTFVGTQVSNASGANITVEIGDITDISSTSDEEAYNRIKGQRIAKTFSKLARDLKDNRREFNEYGYLRSVNLDNLLIVWNGDQYDDVLKIDLPTIFHKDGMFGNLNEMVLPSRYFGTVITESGTADGTQRSLVEKDYDGVHIFSGDIIPTGANFEANEAYVEDGNIVAKVFVPEGIPFMSAFEVGTSFVNPKSLTENHYLTWGHNTLERLKEYPFVTIKLGE